MAFLKITASSLHPHAPYAHQHPLKEEQLVFKVISDI